MGNEKKEIKLKVDNMTACFIEDSLRDRIMQIYYAGGKINTKFEQSLDELVKLFADHCKRDENGYPLPE